MRIYMDAPEALEEIKRDLAEMGIRVRPATMQNKVVAGNKDFETLELQNYNYTILDAKSHEVPGVSQPWARAEFGERVSEHNEDVNPGEAWKLRPEVWTEYLNSDGKFCYTYNERMRKQLVPIMEQLANDPDSRQIWMSIWNPDIDLQNIGGKKRVPCSLGYGFQIREGVLNLHYMMRSCDFATHMNNDIYLAMRLLEHVAETIGYPVGNFTHSIFSLHVYQKDIKGVF